MRGVKWTISFPLFVTIAVCTGHAGASGSRHNRHVDDLLRSMTLEEQISQLSSTSPAVEGKLSAFNWWAECLHGLKEEVLREGATIFPNPLGMAATFDAALVHSVGNIVSDEMRAKNNAEMLKTNRSRMLNCFDPNINIYRDPRWGRGQETFGEDPLLTGVLASSYVRGLQGDHPDYWKIGATCKHFAAHSIEEADGTSRFRFDAQVSDRDLEETYLPAFEACVRQGNVRSVMCAYSSVNGVPACANEKLLQNTLRDAWGFDGFVVSDCGAVEAVSWGHGYRSSNVEAAAATLNAGTDLSCTNYSYLKAALAAGLVNATYVTRAARRMLTARAKLGMFSAPGNQPFAHLGPETIGAPAHKAKAVEVVEKGSVLLKNTRSGDKERLLPLDSTAGERIVVAGPMAHTTDYLLGNYYGHVAGEVVTPFQAIKDKVDGATGTLVTHHPGARVSGWNAGGIDQTIGFCQEADICILCLGTSSIDAHSANDPAGRFTMWSPIQEGEMLDRTSVRLPGVQEDLVKGVAKHTSAHIIVILIHGGPLDISWLKESQRVGAIMTAFYPGQGAAGIANLLFGEATFSGKLPVTFYHNNYTEQIKMGDMRMAEYPGRTYRYLQVPAVYDFGHGLSYATFGYSRLSWGSVKAALSYPPDIHVTVQNTGTIAGDEVVMVFVEPTRCPTDARPHNTLPRKSLKAFRRVHLQPQAAVDLTFPMAATHFMLHGIQDAHTACEWAITIGEHRMLMPRMQQLDAELQQQQGASISLV